MKSFLRNCVKKVVSYLTEDRPCYRCAAVAKASYAGYDYCRICRDVVLTMQSAVHHDPPFGFPGSKGYVEFPKKEESK